MLIIEFYHKNSNVVAYYKFTNSDGDWNERIYDEDGKLLTYKNSDGEWNERTYDENGRELTFKNSNGYQEERTYDEKGNELAYKDSDGCFIIRDKLVTKEEFEAFVNPSENSVLKKIAELEEQLKELKKLINQK